MRPGLRAAGGDNACGAPVAPHDGSSTGIYIYDQDESTLTIEGKGSHIALPKAVNGEELGSVGDTPDSIVYQILELDNDRLTVTLESGPGVWWTFRLKKVDGSNNNDSSNAGQPGSFRRASGLLIDVDIIV